MEACKEKILIMDDEEVVRLVAGDILRYLGYEVEFAQDGNEAIALCAEAVKENKPFHVALLDISIPGGMGGKDAIKELTVIDPNLRVLVSSGNANDPVLSAFREYGFAGVVLKPYQVGELSQKIIDVLAGR